MPSRLVRTPARRRQRSVRVTVAIALLGTATALVAVALPTQSAVALSVAAVAAIVLGWAALRMMWTEVLQSRRENAADRAAQAAAYRELFAERAAEHAEFTSVMTERLADSQLSQRELEGVLQVEQRRAAVAEHRLAETARDLDEAAERVRDLESELAAEVARRQAEEAAALAAWEDEGGDPLADLVALAEPDEVRSTRSA